METSRTRGFISAVEDHDNTASQRVSPNLNLQIYDMSREDFENQLAYKMGYRAYTPWGAKEYIFHKEVNQFIDKFADGQTFESTVPAGYFPNLISNTEETIY